MTTFIRVSNDTLIPLKSVQSIRFVQAVSLQELSEHVGEDIDSENLSITDIVRSYLPTSKCLKHTDEDGNSVLTIEHNYARKRHNITHVITDYHGVFVIETDTQEYVLTYADVQFFELHSLILKPLGLM